MESPAKKKGKMKQEIQDEEDRMSTLADEVIHKILSFTDAKQAVRTSVLSKRWKLIWLTLPFLNFGLYDYSLPYNTRMFCLIETMILMFINST